jgi:NADPH:quinone reductase-like Zn-dependent oxidoreductase
MIAEDKIRLRIAQEYPLAKAPQAHRDMESHKLIGKLLLRP